MKQQKEDKKTPLVLMILDGWGYSEEKQHNAIYKAHTPQWDDWWRTQPHMLLNASGYAVGLPDAQMGNSEVGHMHIGAGRIIEQEFTRINHAIGDETYNTNPIFLKVIKNLKQSNKALHIMGLLSPGGVHSHEDHLFAFLKLCYQQQFTNIYLHLFLDGRDTPPQSAKNSIAKLKTQLQFYPVAKIASICGRYYAMDRDTRWERIEDVYNLLTENHSPYCYASVEDAINAFYKQGIFDEFIPPTIIGTGSAIKDDDAIFFFNFRADRARQLTSAFVEKNFQGFSRTVTPKLAAFISMTCFSSELKTDIAFPKIDLHNTLGEVIANNGLHQLRLAETEKYAHVTFFLNGGTETIFQNEERKLIASPHIATYDLKPEMSAAELTNTLIKAIASQKYDIIICNYANADMVGHTGNFAATVTAIEYLDSAMHDVWLALKALNGQLLITADHGNAESMFDETTHQAHTAHTNGPVPLLYIGDKWHFIKPQGSLIDVSPTVLTLLGITPPKEMTGHSLLAENHVA